MATVYLLKPDKSYWKATQAMETARKGQRRIELSVYAW